MLSLDTLQESIRALTATLLNTNVIVANPDVPGARPPGTYLTCIISHINPIGRFEMKPVDVNGNVFVTTTWELTVTFESVRDKAANVLQSFASMFRNPLVIDQFLGINLSFMRSMGMIAIPELLDTVYEYRNTMDVIFNIGETEQINTSYIQTTEMVGDILKPDGSTLEKEVDLSIGN